MFMCFFLLYGKVLKYYFLLSIKKYMLHEQPILLSDLLTSGQIGRSEVIHVQISNF